MNHEVKSLERLWRDAYPQDLDRTLPPPAHGSIHAMWRQACRRFGPQVAYSMGSLDLSYAQIEAHSTRFAAWLGQVQGFAPGDRVAVMLPNVLHYPIALLGALRAGAVVVNVNPQYTPRELSHQLRDSGASVIVLCEHQIPLLKSCFGDTAIRQVVVVPQDFSLHASACPENILEGAHPGQSVDWVEFNAMLAAPGAVETWKDFNASPQDIAFLQYTGGTTGLSKGAMLTHANILSNVAQAHSWFRSKIRDGKEVVLTALPLYHIFALTANCLLFAQCGARNVLIPNPRNMQTLLDCFSRAEITVLTGVNTLFNGLLHSPNFAASDFSGLKLVVAGGAAVQNAVAQKWVQVTGVPIVEGYGLTEASPFVSCNFLDESFNGTIGFPLPSTFIEIRNDSGHVEPIGTEGEICIRGPQVMKGYWQRPMETVAAIDGNGWLRTGDVGVIDSDGRVRITDRKKDLILVSGFNVYPSEIESVLASHPDVFEAAAIGVADEQTGEAVKVYIVKGSATLTEAALIAHCRAQLTAYKVPRSVIFVDSLPKSNVGKILRRELRATLDASSDVLAAGV